MTTCPYCWRTDGGHDDGCIGAFAARPKPKILDLEEGKRRRDAGMAKAAAAAEPYWKAQARAILAELAISRTEITADDLWQSGLDVPDGHANALGSIFTSAARDGLIENTHRTVRSARPGNHARAIPVWRSLVRVAS